MRITSFNRVFLLILFIFLPKLIFAQLFDFTRKADAILENPKTVKIQKLSNLNSYYRETNLSISPDGKYLFFMSGRGGQYWSVPNYLTYKGKAQYDGDILYTQKLNNNWQSPMNVGAQINTFMGEDEPNVSPDGQKVYFQSWKDNWEVTGGPYYVSSLNGKTWGYPKGLGGGINAFFVETQYATRGKGYGTDGATFSPDGNIFIVAAGPEYDGNMDLYISKKDKNGYWSYCKKLSVSTLGDERSPFIAADGKTLYFASDGYTRAGKLDIFKTTLHEDGSIGEVINIGVPFNTAQDDYGFIVTASGKEAYFVRDGDIHFADITTAPQKLKPLPTLIISGKITSSKNQHTLQATVIIKDEKTNKVLAKTTSNAYTGEYSIVLNKIPSGVLQDISKQGYEPTKKKLKIENTKIANKITSDIALTPIEKPVPKPPTPKVEKEAAAGMDTGKE